MVVVQLVVLVAFIVMTGWALEAGGVAIVQTAKADGTARTTHVWYVQHEGETLLEAGRARAHPVAAGRQVWLAGLVDRRRVRHVTLSGRASRTRGP